MARVRAVKLTFKQGETFRYQRLYCKNKKAGMTRLLKIIDNKCYFAGAAGAGA
jgi:hypothetical protein